MPADLYRTVILDHGRRPRNLGRLARATHRADGDNPLCGDTIRLELELDGGTVRRAGFEGAACMVATASASLMTESLTGRTPAEALALAERVEALSAGRPAGAGAGAGTETGGGTPEVELGELAALAGVRHHPLRVRCATLPWQALRRALGT
jgi:nitrogen fixation NifU-like protein